MEGEEVEMGALKPQEPHPAVHIHSSQQCQESCAPVCVCVCVCPGSGRVNFTLK